MKTKLKKELGCWLQFGIVSVMAVALLAGCATAPNPEPQAQGTSFYPPLPNPPRIQYLKTLTGERDMGAPASDFSKFVLGDETRTLQLKQPYGVGLYGGKLYVVDTSAPGLAVFDLVQQRFEVMTGAPSGRMKRPINITIDSDGTKYVTDTGRDQILVFDRSDRFVQAYGSPGQFKPVDVAIAGDRLYVTDIQHHEVQVLDKHTGKFLFKFGSAGSKQGELFHPTNIAIDTDGDVYVVETSNFRVQRFTAEGRSVRIYGDIGSESGTFSRPKGIALDRNNRIYVGDAAFQNVQIFDREGRLLLFFGQPGGDVEGLNLPTGIKVDYDNVKYFQAYADPKFHVEYLVFVVSQFGPNKVDVFGYGRMNGMDYAADEAAAAKSVTKPVPKGEN